MISNEISLVGCKIAGEELEEGRFANSVRTYDGDARAQIDAKINVDQKWLLALISKGDV